MVKAVERTSHLYAVMAVRGYGGSMAEESLGTLGRNDWLPIGMGISAVALAMFWK
jgi:energy-coupling factor transporter transmembrane protein EcfT